MGPEHVYFPKNRIQLLIRKGLGSGRLADTMLLDGSVGSFQFDGFSTSQVVSGLVKRRKREKKFPTNNMSSLCQTAPEHSRE
jgi:hypothetical protein